MPKAFERFEKWLSQLPANYISLSQDERAKVLLQLKGTDAREYRKLRAQAIRCAQ